MSWLLMTLVNYENQCDVLNVFKLQVRIKAAWTRRGRLVTAGRGLGPFTWTRVICRPSVTKLISHRNDRSVRVEQVVLSECWMGSGEGLCRTWVHLDWNQRKCVMFLPIFIPALQSTPPVLIISCTSLHLLQLSLVVCSHPTSLTPGLLSKVPFCSLIVNPSSWMTLWMKWSAKMYKCINRMCNKPSSKSGLYVKLDSRCIVWRESMLRFFLTVTGMM